MSAWVEHWPSVATKTGQRAASYVGWPSLYRHYACLESWASLSSGTVSNLPNAVTGQGYTVSTPLVTTAQNGSNLGSVSQGIFSPQGWNLITNGDLIFIGTSGLTFTLCPGVSIASANASTPYTLVFGTTAILPSVKSAYWVYRLAWSTTWNQTTVSAGVATYPNLPVLQVVGSGSPITGCVPSFSLAQSYNWLQTGYALLGGAPLLVGPQKYSMYLTTPTTQYGVPYTLSYPTNRWYDFGASWEKRFGNAPTGQAYIGSPHITTATSTTSAQATAQAGGGMLMMGVGGSGTMIQIPNLGNALSGDLVYIGPSSTAFPQFQLTPSISLQGTSTQVMITISGVTTPVVTLANTGNWIARLAWTTTGGTTTLQAGASTNLGAPPTLATMGSVTALTSISPQFVGGTWGNAAALSSSGTATPHFPYLAQLAVPAVIVSISETGTDSETKMTGHVSQDFGVESEATVLAAATLTPETALGSEILTALGKLILSGTGQGAEILLTGQPKSLSESGTSSEVLQTTVAILLSEIAASIPGLDATITNAVNQNNQYIGIGGIDQLIMHAVTVTNKMTGKGKETIRVKHPLSETGTGTATTRVTYTAKLLETGTGSETVQGKLLKVTQESAVGTASLTLKVIWNKNESGTGTEKIKLLWPLRETATGREVISWIHYQGLPPQLPQPLITEQGIELPIPYGPDSVNQLNLGGFFPGAPQMASGPVTTAQQIPVGSIYTFVFTRNTSLNALNGTVGSMTFQIPDGRWYTGTASFVVKDLASNGLTEILATITGPISLAQPLNTAMMY